MLIPGNFNSHLVWLMFYNISMICECSLLSSIWIHMRFFIWVFFCSHSPSLSLEFSILNFYCRHLFINFIFLPWLQPTYTPVTVDMLNNSTKKRRHCWLSEYCPFFRIEKHWQLRISATYNRIFLVILSDEVFASLIHT